MDMRKIILGVLAGVFLFCIFRDIKVEDVAKEVVKAQVQEKVDEVKEDVKEKIDLVKEKAEKDVKKKFKLFERLIPKKGPK